MTIRAHQCETLKIKELERENSELKSKLKPDEQNYLDDFLDDFCADPKANVIGSSEHQVQLCNNEHVSQINRSNDEGADAKELAQLRKQLTDITRDYQKAIRANKIIQDKYRQLRQRYNTDVQNPQVKRITASPDDKSRVHSSLREEQTKGACNPDLSFSTSLLNSTPNPVSPFEILSENLQSLSSHEVSFCDTRLRHESSIKNKDATTQDIPDRSPVAGQGSTADTSDETPTPSRPAGSVKNAHGKTITDGMKPPIKIEDEDSDFPVLVSEKSLKRKRTPAPKKTASGEIRKAENPQGSIIKPVHIKSDPGSSSPNATITQQGFESFLDSLDLDDLEERHLTPRKRRGFIDQTWPSSSRDVFPTVVEPDVAQHNWPDNTKEGSISQQQNLWHENQPDMSLVRDEASYKMKAEEYAAKLMEEESRNRFCLGARTESNQEPPPQILQNKYAKAARQYSHNQKTHERRERLVNLRQEPSKANSQNLHGATMTDALYPTEQREIENRLANSAGSDNLNESTLASGSKSEISKAPPSTPSALRSLDVNTHIVPRTSSLPKNEAQNRIRRLDDHGAANISHLAEDGETLNPVSDLEIRKGTSIIDKNEAAHQNSRAPDLFNRLDSLLKASPIAGEPYTKLTKSAATTETLPNTPSPQIFKKGLPTPDSMRKCTLGIDKVVGRFKKPSVQNSRNWKPSPSNLAAMDKPEEVHPENEPLRCRPIHSLSREDFKLNPSRNQGYNHAFVEVVRNRDQRKCMPGCTRPDCCGNALRKAVEIGGYTAPRKSRLSNPPYADGREEELEEPDQQLLEEWFGDDPARLAEMPAAERQELVLKAKTEKFANQHGKHRHVYGRGSTPPGFWDTDMPTTQQALEYRKAAAAMEQDKVQDMYREAMRPNGQYKFRDE